MSQMLCPVEVLHIVSSYISCYAAQFLMGVLQIAFSRLIAV